MGVPAPALIHNPLVAETTRKLEWSLGILSFLILSALGLATRDMTIRTPLRIAFVVVITLAIFLSLKSAGHKDPFGRAMTVSLIAYVVSFALVAGFVAALVVYQR